MKKKIVPALVVLMLSVLLSACGNPDIQAGLPPGVQPTPDPSITQPGPEVFLEVFPVFLSQGEPFVLIPENRDSWQFAMLAAPHAHAQVESRLSAGNLEAEIIHSTSWRQDKRNLVLTYLSVITNPEKIPEKFTVVPVEQSGIVRSGATTPPPEIPTKAVIHHAFQHLAWLYQTDTEIREVLGIDWQTILRGYEIQPAKIIDD